MTKATCQEQNSKKHTTNSVDKTLSGFQSRHLHSIDVYSKENVAILLGTHNGQEFLGAQLDSIAHQTHTSWKVYVSDDGSVDGTQPLLKQYQERWGRDRLSLCNGSRKGFAANFLSLAVNPEINANFFAYADQDDIWHPNKLDRALQWLQGTPEYLPALYFARTELIDEQGNAFGLSPLFSKPPSFANALVQSTAGGNTMVFNLAARQLLCKVGNNHKVTSHDWWTYLLVAGHGGAVLYDDIPTVSYRQHRGNLVGSNSGWLAKLHRARQLLQGHFRNLIETNMQALQQARPWLSYENLQLLDQFCAARRRWWLLRLLAVQRCGVYRQYRLDNIGLGLAALLNRL